MTEMCCRKTGHPEGNPYRNPYLRPHSTALNGTAQKNHLE